MAVWKELLDNRVLLTAAVGWFLAQFLKTMLFLIINREWNWERMWGAGGMPSSHSATVCACATSIGMTSGFESAIFALACVFAFIVMYDAANVRKETGEQAKILNYMMEHWGQFKPELFAQELKELIGHTPIQVLAGILIGIANALLIYFVVYR